MSALKRAARTQFTPFCFFYCSPLEFDANHQHLRDFPGFSRWTFLFSCLVFSPSTSCRHSPLFDKSFKS